MVHMSTAPTLFGKPLNQRATWPKFTSEQRANYERIAVEQRQINDMADARLLVQIYHSKDKDIQREWMQGAFLKIVKTSGAAQMEKIRSCMTKVRLTEYENNIT
jgi:hypothetical protein|tara:strand:- start:110 stop:421 length:312 start_codon:yes stop_codon:yes gene_type:complete